MTTCSTYPQLLNRWPAEVREPNENLACFSERHLQAMWLEQRYFTPLKTHLGEVIEIVSPGIWNVEAGPDFRRAHLRIGGRDYIGDVEIHLVDSSWYYHHHDQDARYNDVILHVSLWQPAKTTPLLTVDKREISRSYIEPALKIPLKRIVQLLDLDLYPYRKFVGSGKCAQTLFLRMPEKKVESLLSSAAHFRLQGKREYLEQHVKDPHFRLSAGIAMALGYKSNTETFLELYLWLRQHEHEPFDTVFAVALGVTGFFTEPYLSRWQSSEEYRSLLYLWSQKSPPADRVWVVEVRQTRPLNHPVRRLAALSHLVVDLASSTMLERCLLVWTQQWHHCKKPRDFSVLRSSILAQLPSYQDPYWSRHFIFGNKESPQPIALIGQDLRLSALVNTFLPMLAGDIAARGDLLELEVFELFYGTLRSPISGKRDYLIHRFFGETQKGQLLQRSLFEQGAFQIHRDFCVHYEASCEGCPFVQRVRETVDD